MSNQPNSPNQSNQPVEEDDTLAAMARDQAEKLKSLDPNDGWEPGKKIGEDHGSYLRNIPRVGTGNKRGPYKTVDPVDERTITVYGPPETLKLLRKQKQDEQDEYWKKEDEKLLRLSQAVNEEDTGGEIDDPHYMDQFFKIQEELEK